MKNALFFIKCVHLAVKLDVDIIEKIDMNIEVLCSLTFTIYGLYLRMANNTQCQNGCKLLGLLICRTSNICLFSMTTNISNEMRK